jgi:putative hydrolase of the HAD superfamily
MEYMLVFDLDDTLYLERDYVRSGFVAVDEWLQCHHSVYGFFDQAWSFFERGVRGSTFNQVLKGMGIEDQQLIRDMVDIYRGHTPDISLLPDSRDFLQRYPKNQMAIITDGPGMAQRSKIRVLGLENRIGQLIVTEDLGQGYNKPCTAAFQRVQGRYKSASCVYIGDNPLKDFQGPLSLHWSPPLRIRRPGSLHFDLPTPEGCIEIESFNDLL